LQALALFTFFGNASQVEATLSNSKGDYILFRQVLSVIINKEIPRILFYLMDRSVALCNIPKKWTVVNLQAKFCKLYFTVSFRITWR